MAAAIGAAIVAGSVASTAAAGPGPKIAATHQASVPLNRCPTHALPLPAEGVARAADQARVQAPALYKGSGHAVVELAWRARFRLNVWAGTSFHCSDLVRRRTVVVDLLLPKYLPSASLSHGVVFVSRFAIGYRVWEVAH